jgi:hypothetical protein
MTEEKKTRLAHILPAKSLFDGELNIPLDDPKFFKKIVSSLQEWVDTRKPNILLEHRRDGESLGEITKVFSDERGIFAEMVLNEETEQKFSEGKFRFVSPTIAWSHKADDYSDRGAWPAALLEVSMVATPRHSRQLPLTHINELSESEVLNTERITQFSALVGPELKTSFIGEIDMSLEELQEVMAGMLAPIVERLAALEAPAEELAEDAEEVKEEEVETVAVEDEEVSEEAVEVEVKEEAELAEDEEDEKEVSSLSEAPSKDLEKRALLAEAKVAELKAVIAMRDAQAVVAKDISSRPHMSSMSEKLVKIYVSDRDLYKEVLGVIPENATSVLAERVTVGFVSENPNTGNPYTAAYALAEKEGISYPEALKRIS